MNALPKLYGFIHVCTENQWKDILLEQIQKIKESDNLYKDIEKIYCGVVGKGDMSFLNVPGLEKFELAYVHHDISQFEFLTLEWMHDFCKRNSRSKVFYIHTKGISTYGRVHVPPSPARQQNIDEWRRYMEHYVLRNYQTCVDELDLSDMVGVNWRGKGTESVITPHVGSHFSGNFWWARASYIASLGNVREGNQKRCNAEFWLGKGTGVVSCLHESDVDHYRQGFPYEAYKGKIHQVYYLVKEGVSESYDSKTK